MSREIKVKTEKQREFTWNKILIFSLLLFFFLYFLVSFFNRDLGISGKATSEENQTAEIRAVIEITNADHLDSSKKLIKDITNEIKYSDGIWSESIFEGEFVRVTFEENLTSSRDIKIYPRIVSGNPKIEVYEKDGNDIIATFDSLVSNDYNQVFLSNLQNSQDTFDLKILGGTIEIDQIIDPVIQQTIAQQAIDIKPLSNNTLLVAYVNSSLSNGTESSLSFSTIFTNGTLKEGTFLIDTAIRNSSVSIGLINSTHFYLGYMDYLLQDELRAIRSMNGTQLLGPTSIDAGNIQFYDTCMAHIGNRTIFGWVDSAEGDFDAVWVNDNSTTTAFIGETSIDATMVPTTNSTNEADCMGINSTHAAFAWVNYTGTDNIDYSVWDFAARNPVTRVIIDDNVGTTGATAITTLDSDKFALAWYDGTDQDISMAIVWANGTNISLATDVNTTAGTGNRLDIATIENSSVGGTDSIAVVWYGQDSGDIMGATFDTWGNRIANDFVIDSSPNTTAKFSEISATGANPETGQSLCSNTFAVAYTNSTGATVFNTYFVNGSVWDGNGCPVPNDAPQWFDNSTNSTRAGEFVEHRVRWTDDASLSSYIFSFDNGNGSFINDSAVVFTGTANWSNITKLVNSTSGSVIRWIIYANDSKNLWNNTDTFSYTTTSDAPPQWSNPTTNNTNPEPNVFVRHNVFWTDDTALSFANLEVNGTGASCDQSANVTNTSLSGTSSSANLTWQIPNQCEGKSIGWRQYSNDSLNQWNSTALQSYQVQNINPNASFGTNPIDNLNSSNSSITFDLKGSDNLGVSYLRLFGNWTGSWIANQTNTSPVNDTFWNITVDEIPDGKYRWAAWTNDTLNNQAFTTTNRTFTVDTVAPVINLPFYTNGTLRTNSQTLTLNISVSDATTSPSSCVVNINGTNQTIAPSSGWCNITNGFLTSLADGNATIFVWANDTLNNWGLNNSFVVKIDSTAPTITLPFYTNATIKSNASTLTLNISVSDSGTSPSVCKVDINGTNQTVSVSSGWCNITNGFLTNLAEGNRTINVYANDSLNTFGINNSFVVFVDATNPLIQFVSPTESNGTSRSRTWIFANVSITEPHFQNVTFKLFNSTGEINTTTFTDSTRSINFTSLSNNNVIYWYNVSSYDSVGNFNQTETRFITLTTDQAPTVTILYPQNTTYNVNINQLNYSATDDISLSSCWYSLNLGVTNSTPDLTCSNFTGLTSSEGSNTWTVYANDSLNQIGLASVIFTKDTTVPSITGISESPSDPQTYSSGVIYRFNATITDTNLNATVITFDGINYTPTNLGSGIYNLSLANLTAGVHNYTWYANDTVGNSNTSSQTYTINQNSQTLHLFFNATSPITYPASFRVFSNSTSSFTIYRNGTAVGNNSAQGLNAGLYNFTVIRTDQQNYSNISAQENFLVNQATGSVFTYLNNSRANITIGQGTQIYLNSTLQTGTGTIKLYNNGTLINQGSSPLANLTTFNTGGLFNITTIYDGNENFTSASETWYVNVTDNIVPNVLLLYPTNTSYNSVQTQLNYSASDNSALHSCWYSTNLGVSNTTITCGQNVTDLDSGQGSSTWRIYANDTSGNQNSSTIVFFVDSVNPLISFVSPTETNSSSQTRNYIQVNVSASDTNLNIITIRLYNSTNSLLRTNYSSTSPFLINYTGLSEGTYYFNSTANDTLNNQNSTETRTVSLVKPTLAIVLPENETYIAGTNLKLNFTAANQDSLSYNIDSGSNTTITGNTTFNTTSGNHTFYLFANNGVGTTIKNISFTVNVSKLIILYNNYSGNGSTTDFNASSFEDLQNLSGVILEKTSYGKIEFNTALNLTNDSTYTDNNLNLDINTNISSNFIEINSTALPNLNKSSTLYLYNLDFTNPRVLRNEELCDSAICTEVSYSGGTFIFNVTQFSNYSAEETPVEVVPSSGGSSNGAGSGSIIRQCTQNSDCSENENCISGRCVKLFDIKILDFESPAKLGDFFDFTYYIKGIGDVNNDVIVSFWIEKSGEKISSGTDAIYLGSFDEKTEVAKIFLPSTFESGVYSFVVEVSYGSYSARSQRTIEVNVKDGFATITPTDIKIRNIVIAFLIFIIVIALVFMTHEEKREIARDIRDIFARRKTNRILKEIKMRLNVLRIKIAALISDISYILRNNFLSSRRKRRVKEKGKIYGRNISRNAKSLLDKIFKKQELKKKVVDEKIDTKEELDQVLDKMEEKKDKNPFFPYK